jgi:alpha-L-fucosidase
MKHLTCAKSYFSLQPTQPFIMIISTKTLLLTSLLCWAAGTAQAAEKADNSEVAAGQHAAIANPGTPPLSNTSAMPHVDSRWFTSAGMGLFIHYGIASAGNVELSWAMIKDATFNQKNRGVITPNTYYALAPQMTAANYNPERWLKAAKEAGFGYAVLTTKHHDGYTLWPGRSRREGARPSWTPIAPGCHSRACHWGSPA